MEEGQQNYSYPKRPMWQWILLYVIVGALVYAAIYYFVFAKKGYNANQQSQYQTPTSTQQVVSPTNSSEASPTTATAAKDTITLMPSGFSPSTLTIKAGETVTWINKSGEAATVNSDPHPVHTNYPPLNLGRFPDGGTLTLTFPKAGTYGYHDHLNPSLRGTIIVQ